MTKPRTSGPWRKVVLSAVAVFFVWQIVSHSFAAYLAPIAPKTALWFNSRQPVALVDLADRGLNFSAGVIKGAANERATDASNTKDVSIGAGNTYEKLNQSFSAFELLDHGGSTSRPLLPPNTPSIRAWAETALLSDPLNAHALRVLGQLAEASNDDTDAAKFMNAAGYLSLHENPANFWLLEKAFRAKDYAAVIHYSDVLLRTSPELGGAVVPVLAYIAQDRGAADLLKTVLAGKPPWRAQFFAMLPQSVTDARIPLVLLSALQTSTAPPTSQELASYIEFLVQKKLYKLAYYSWLQFLPVEELHSAGLLFNGNFDVVPSGLPFDWEITSGSGVTNDIVPILGSGNQHGLMLDFQTGRVDYRSVTELVMLTPGTYKFQGKYKGKLVGPRGLKWRIVCAGGSTGPVGESEMIIGVIRDWANVAFTFTIPAEDCPAQYVRLDFDARMASEQFLSGSVLFRQLEIARLLSPPS